MTKPPRRYEVNPDTACKLVAVVKGILIAQRERLKVKENELEIEEWGLEIAGKCLKWKNI